MRGQLAALLDGVAAGRFPPPDGGVTILPQPSPRDAGVLAFTAHSVIVIDLDPAWVRGQLPPGDLSGPLQPAFLQALCAKTGRRVNSTDMLCVAAPQPGPPPGAPWHHGPSQRPLADLGGMTVGQTPPHELPATSEGDAVGGVEQQLLELARQVGAPHQGRSWRRSVTLAPGDSVAPSSGLLLSGRCPSVTGSLGPRYSDAIGRASRTPGAALVRPHICAARGEFQLPAVEKSAARAAPSFGRQQAVAASDAWSRHRGGGGPGRITTHGVAARQGPASWW